MSASVVAGDVEAYLRLGELKHLFAEAEEQAFRVVDRHVERYGKLPGRGVVERELRARLPKATEPAAYYHDRLVDRFLRRGIRRVVDSANEFMVGEERDARRALGILLDGLLDLDQGSHGQDIVDFRSGGVEAVYRSYEAMRRGATLGIPLGWPTVDEENGGAQRGDLVSFVGRPEMGKTWLMLWMAQHAWRTSKKRVLFCTIEMKPLTVYRRIASICTGIPYRSVKGGHFARHLPDSRQRTPEDYRRALQALTKEDQPLWVMDSKMAGTVADLHRACRQLRPDVVFVDGAYLLRHPDARLGRYQKVAENIDLLKGRLAIELDLPTVCSFQFGREAEAKIKKGQRPGLEDIAHSDAIGQHSSIVMGLFQEESPENLVRRRVDILKGREGEEGEFYIDWDFRSMRFGEAEEGPQDPVYGV